MGDPYPILSVGLILGNVTTQTETGWGDGLVGKELATQPRGPEFNPPEPTKN